MKRLWQDQNGALISLYPWVNFKGRRGAPCGYPLHLCVYRQLSAVCFWKIRWRHKKKSDGRGFTYVLLQPEVKGSILNSFCCRSLSCSGWFLQTAALMLVLVRPSSASALSNWKSLISCSHKMTPYLPFPFMVTQIVGEGSTVVQHFCCRPKRSRDK